MNTNPKTSGMSFEKSLAERYPHGIRQTRTQWGPAATPPEGGQPGEPESLDGDRHVVHSLMWLSCANSGRRDSSPHRLAWTSMAILYRPRSPRHSIQAPKKQSGGSKLDKRVEPTVASHLGRLLSRQACCNLPNLQRYRHSPGV